MSKQQLQATLLNVGLMLSLVGILLAFILVQRLRNQNSLRSLDDSLIEDEEASSPQGILREQLLQFALLTGFLAGFIVGSTLSVALLRLYDTAYKPVFSTASGILAGLLSLLFLLLGYRILLHGPKLVPSSANSPQNALERRLQLAVASTAGLCGILLLFCAVLAHR